MSQMPSNCPAVVFGRSGILPVESDDSPALSPDMDRLATWMTMMEVTGCMLFPEKSRKMLGSWEGLRDKKIEIWPRIPRRAIETAKP